jgi:phage tail sheath protein FI
VGARTLRGADAAADEYKYIPVRRTALFIEESLYRGLKWVVFEPNDEPLWAQIRLNVGAFMHNMFRQGAFQGRRRAKPTRQVRRRNDHAERHQPRHREHLVGFAPLKPAEFVIIKLQQHGRPDQDVEETPWPVLVNPRVSTRTRTSSSA